MVEPLDLPQTPSLRLGGKRALVTGAGRGIGAACAVALAQADATVTLAARTEREIVELADAIVSAGGRADHMVLDVVNWTRSKRRCPAVRPMIYWSTMRAPTDRQPFSRLRGKISTRC